MRAVLHLALATNALRRTYHYKERWGKLEWEKRSGREGEGREYEGPYGNLKLKKLPKIHTYMNEI